MQCWSAKYKAKVVREEARQQFSIADNLPAPLPLLSPPGEVKQQQETFVVVKTGACYCHLVGGGPGYCSTSFNTQDSPRGWRIT